MQNTYQVQREGESLVARLLEDDTRKIELTYRNSKGDVQVSMFRNGSRVSSRVTMANGSYPTQDSKGNTYVIGTEAAYTRFGQELREQMPSDWHPVLGRWLAPKG